MRKTREHEVKVKVPRPRPAQQSEGEQVEEVQFAAGFRRKEPLGHALALKLAQVGLPVRGHTHER